MALVELKNVAPNWSVREGDTVPCAPWDDTDFIRPDKERAKFREDVEDTVLEDDQEIAVCRVEGRIMVHRLACSEDEYANALLQSRIASTSD